MTPALTEASLRARLNGGAALPAEARAALLGGASLGEVMRLVLAEVRRQEDHDRRRG